MKSKYIQNSNIDVGAEVVEDGDREFIVRGKGFFKSLLYLLKFIFY